MTGTLIYFKTIKLAIATTLVVNVRVPFNFTTWNKVVYTSGYVITYIIKTTEPNHLILILNLANKSYFIIKVIFCHLLAWFKHYDPLKVGVNSFWDTLYRIMHYEVLFENTSRFPKLPKLKWHLFPQNERQVAKFHLKAGSRFIMFRLYDI